MKEMFKNCSKLKSIKMNGGLNTSVKVDDILSNAGVNVILGDDEKCTFNYTNGETLNYDAIIKSTNSNIWPSTRWEAVDSTVKTADE
jgi:hypothetical protein